MGCQLGCVRLGRDDGRDAGHDAGVETPGVVPDRPLRRSHRNGRPLLSSDRLGRRRGEPGQSSWLAHRLSDSLIRFVSGVPLDNPSSLMDA